MLSHISITLSSLLWLLLWQERGETRGEEPGGWTQMPPPPPAGCQPSIFVLCPPLSFFKAISDFDLLANLLNHKFQLIVCLKFAPFIFNRKKNSFRLLDWYHNSCQECLKSYKDNPSPLIHSLHSCWYWLTLDSEWYWDGRWEAQQSTNHKKQSFAYNKQLS